MCVGPVERQLETEASREKNQASVGWERSMGLTAMSCWRHRSRVAGFSLWGSLPFLVSAGARQGGRAAPARGGSSSL